ncbi:hypothetical protein P7K49_027762 [Saguinus oedipus]|uniref:Uncharacterized protein n=1 Tax=Saguinus oedipus TaxID=9490 RepID=A0ABQ9UAC4_SAGOE|nr:hypothetical protein P7K49_027762 [Saguinus oedipus]
MQEGLDSYLISPTPQCLETPYGFDVSQSHTVEERFQMLRGCPMGPEHGGPSTPPGAFLAILAIDLATQTLPCFRHKIPFHWQTLNFQTDCRDFHGNRRRVRERLGKRFCRSAAIVCCYSDERTLLTELKTPEIGN